MMLNVGKDYFGFTQNDRLKVNSFSLIIFFFKTLISSSDSDSSYFRLLIINHSLVPILIIGAYC